MPEYTPLERELLALIRPQASLTTAPRTAATALPTLDPSMLMSATGQRELQAAQRPVASFERTASTPEVAISDDALNTIMLFQAMQETGASEDSFDFTPMHTSDEIQFDTEFFEGEGRTEPNPRARFQVGRESPPRVDFSARNFPVGGQVVSQRGPDGFRPVTSQTPAAGAPVRSVAPTRTVVRTVAEPSSGPPASRYQLLLQSSRDDF